MVPVHHFQHSESVKLRHHDIKQDQGKLRAMFLDTGNSLYSVLRLNDLVFAFKHIGQNRPVHFRVVGNQYFLFKLLFLAHFGSFLNQMITSK